MSLRSLRPTLRLLGLLAMLVSIAPGHALQIPDDIKKRLLGSNDDRAAPGQDMGSESIDNSIDPATYLVGGGDGFHISIVGLPSQRFSPVIGADGDIYEGELGVIRMGRLPLGLAVDSIARHVRGVLKRNYRVHVTLNRLKTPVVTVSGAVANPGTYALPGNRRLLDAIKMANGNEMPMADAVDLRQVVVMNRDSTRIHDMLRFLSRGDLTQNPYVYPGDNIQLRASDARVYIAGEVMKPVTGWTPIRPDETLAGLLEVIRPKRTADTGRVLIQQAALGSKAGTASVAIQDAAGIKLGHGDLITVPLAGGRRALDTAMVSGEVVRPGTFPVIVGVTTVADLIAEAGGSTEAANPARAFIVRTSKIVGANRNLADELDREGALFRRQAGVYVQMVRPEINASYIDMRQSGDFSVLEVGDGASSVRVEAGDRIHVPRREGHVYVSGAVKNPGAYPFQAGKDYAHYVRLAGGYASKANPTERYAVGFYGGVTKMKAADRLAEGDVLVIPSSIEFKTYSTVFLPLIQIVPTLLSLVVSILILSKQ